jgi:hypothetical protein
MENTRKKMEEGREKLRKIIKRRAEKHKKLRGDDNDEDEEKPQF